MENLGSSTPSNNLGASSPAIKKSKIPEGFKLQKFESESRDWKMEYYQILRDDKAPNIEDFRYYYGRDKLREFKNESMLKVFKIQANENQSTEEDEKSIEGLVYSILDGKAIGKGFKAFPGSRYDDIKQGTDIVLFCEVEKSDKPLTYSIDVTTGTSKKTVQSKFASTYGSGRNGNSSVRFCRDPKTRKMWDEEEAPHFIIGVSPASVINTVSSGKVFYKEKEGEQGVDIKNVDNIIVALSGEDYKNTVLKILAEFHAQIEIQKSLVNNQENLSQNKKVARRKYLVTLGAQIKERLTGLLGIDKEGKNPNEISAEFSQKFNKKVKELLREDTTFGNIMSEVSNYSYIADRQRGSKTYKAAKASA